MKKWITWGISMGLAALLLLTPALWLTHPDKKSHQPVTNREQVIDVEDLLVPIQADTLAVYISSFYGKRYQSIRMEPGSKEWLLSWNRSAQILMNQLGEGYDQERKAYVEAGLVQDKGDRTILTLPVIKEEEICYLATPVMVLNELLRKVQDH